tara:strand:+ start:123 stop:560 length:438 start_codon:yes stop_codon:yes gene_type:complete
MVDKCTLDAILYITVKQKGKQMNFKAHAINITSSTLSAVALVGALSVIPAKAHAGDELRNILGAIAVIGVINEVYKDRTDNVNRVADVYGSKHNPLNEARRPGYASGLNNYNKVCNSEVIRHQGYSEVVDTNCFGQILNVRIVRR